MCLGETFLAFLVCETRTSGSAHPSAGPGAATFGSSCGPFASPSRYSTALALPIFGGRNIPHAVKCTTLQPSAVVVLAMGAPAEWNALSRAGWFCTAAVASGNVEGPWLAGPGGRVGSAPARSSWTIARGWKPITAALSCGQPSRGKGVRVVSQTQPGWRCQGSAAAAAAVAAASGCCCEWLHTGLPGGMISRCSAMDVL